MFCFIFKLSFFKGFFSPPVGHYISSLNNSVTDLLLLDIIHETNEELLLQLFSAWMSADFPWGRQSQHSWEEMHTLREKNVNLWGFALRVCGVLHPLRLTINKCGLLSFSFDLQTVIMKHRRCLASWFVFRRSWVSKETIKIFIL